MCAQPDSPQVSVITATYNWSSVLRYAIQSVLWQTVQDFEMLIIGDGCTDDSAEMVASFGVPRLVWHNLPQNSGHQSVPNNTGLTLARGRYIAYLGHDDLWYPTHLEKLLSALQGADGDVGYSVSIMIGPPGSGVRRLRGLDPPTTARLWVPPSSLMHRHSLINEIGPWKEYRTIPVHPEIDLLDRAAAHGCKFVAVGDVTAFKFPASWRPNSYRDKYSHEQAEYVRRIQAEPDFLYRELMDVIRAYTTAKTEMGLIPKARKIVPLGWHVEQMRRLRGVEPRPIPAFSVRQALSLVWYATTYVVYLVKRSVRHALRSKNS